MLTQRAPLCEVLLWGSDAEDMKERMMLHVFISLLLPRSGLGSANRTALRSENKKKICCLHAFSSSHTRKRRPLGVADLAHYLLLQKALVLPLQLFLQASHRSLCWSHGSFIFRKISGGDESWSFEWNISEFHDGGWGTFVTSHLFFCGRKDKQTESLTNPWCLFPSVKFKEN